MQLMKESIFSSSVRSFCSALFKVLGLSMGLIPIIFLIVLIASGGAKQEVKSNYHPLVLSNADWKRSHFDQDKPSILHLDIQGGIGLGEVNKNTLRSQLLASKQGVMKDNPIKAIFLYLNSPGGTVDDSDAIYRSLIDYKTRYQVPIYAFVDGICASGALYVAAAADKVFATDVSLVGSVGVVFQFINVSKGMEKLGVSSLTLTEGKGKDAMNPLRPWTDGEEQKFRLINQFYYKRFVDLLVASRSQLDRNLLEKEYGASVFPAPIAKDYGFVDKIVLTKEDVLQEIIKDLNLSRDHYQTIAMQPKTWLFSDFQKGLSFFNGGVKLQHHFVNFPLDEQFMNKHLYLYGP